MLTALEPDVFPWLDHRRYSFSLGVRHGPGVWLSGHTALTLHLDSFWPTALLAALVVSFVSLVLNAVLPDGKDD